jgi:hypothetical protein
MQTNPSPSPRPHQLAPLVHAYQAHLGITLPLDKSITFPEAYDLNPSKCNTNEYENLAGRTWEGTISPRTDTLALRSSPATICMLKGKRNRERWKVKKRHRLSECKRESVTGEDGR